MWVQILVVAIVLWLVWFVARQKPTAISALKKVGILLLGIAMIVSVLLPDLTTRLANLLGIGRGADLLLYGLTATFVLYALTQYTRSQANRRLTFSLARRVALLDARNRDMARDLQALRANALDEGSANDRAMAPSSPPVGASGLEAGSKSNLDHPTA